MQRPGYLNGLSIRRGKRARLGRNPQWKHRQNITTNPQWIPQLGIIEPIYSPDSIIDPIFRQSSQQVQRQHPTNFQPRMMEQRRSLPSR